MSGGAHELQQAMRQALLAHAPLTALLGGGHVFDEVPRGEPPLYAAFTSVETRDASVFDSRAYEHVVIIEARTNARAREIAQAIAGEIDAALHGAALTLAGHTLVNLSTIAWTVTRTRSKENFGAVIRFRAVTEPQ